MDGPPSTAWRWNSCASSWSTGAARASLSWTNWVASRTCAKSCTHRPAKVSAAGTDSRWRDGDFCKGMSGEQHDRIVRSRGLIIFSKSNSSFFAEISASFPTHRNVVVNLSRYLNADRTNVSYNNRDEYRVVDIWVQRDHCYYQFFIVKKVNLLGQTTKTTSSLVL